MKGRCLCGAVTIETAGRPEYVNICNCRMCRCNGTACAYFRPDDVTISGETRGFERTDIGDVWLTSHFCPICGSTTHCTPTKNAPLDRMSVNVRLFPMEQLEGIEVRYQDGQSVESADDEFVTIAIGHMGDGKAF